MTLEKVQQIITKSDFPEDLKKRLNTILPDLETHSLRGLGQEISRKDSALISSHLVMVWENFARILGGFKKKDYSTTQDFFKLLKEISDLLNDEEKLYFLNLVLDVRTLANASKINFSVEQYREILDYEISLFWHLPKEEVIFFLENQLLFLESKADLAEEIKVVTWENDWDYTKNFSKIFSDLLLQNKEMLGGKAIGDWIQEYFNFSASSSSRTDVVHVVEFLVKDPSVQKLNEKDRKTLSEILKLYLWFLEPEINEEEIFEYQEEIRQAEAKRIEQMFPVSATNTVTKEVSPRAAPPSSNASILKPISGIQNLPKPAQPKPSSSINLPPPHLLTPQPYKPGNIQDLLKAKIPESSIPQKTGFTSNPMFGTPINSQDKEIDKKLEDLKKRVEKE